MRGAVAALAAAVPHTGAAPQSVLHPSSTPGANGRRFLVWNLTGMVISRDENVFSAIEVQPIAHPCTSAPPYDRPSYTLTPTSTLPSHIAHARSCPCPCPCLLAHPHAPTYASHTHTPQRTHARPRIRAPIRIYPLTPRSHPLTRIRIYTHACNTPRSTSTTPKSTAPCASPTASVSPWPRSTTTRSCSRAVPTTGIPAPWSIAPSRAGLLTRNGRSAGAQSATCPRPIGCPNGSVFLPASPLASSHPPRTPPLTAGPAGAWRGDAWGRRWLQVLRGRDQRAVCAGLLAHGCPTCSLLGRRSARHDRRLRRDPCGCLSLGTRCGAGGPEHAVGPVRHA